MTMKQLVAAVAGAAVSCLAAGGLAQTGSDDASQPRRGVVGWANQAVIVESPVRVDTREHEGMYSTPLTVSRDALDGIRGAESVAMIGFPISDAELVDLDLRRIRVFDENAEFVNATNPAETLAERNREGRTLMFGGEVAGAPGSAAFIAITPTGTNGFVRLDGELHVISSGRHVEGAQPVVFSMSSLPEGYIDWKEFECNAIDPRTLAELNETEITPERMEAVLTQLPIAPPAEGGGAGGSFARSGDDPIQDCRIVDVGIEADVELGNEFLSADDPREALTDYIETLVATVSFIYIEQFNLEFRIIFQRDWIGQPTNADPWDGLSTLDVLFELIGVWNSDTAPTPLDWDGVHLLSARPLGGGVAFLGAICDLDFAHAVSADLNAAFPLDPDGRPVTQDEANWDIVVVAHEWGHNLGAPHTHGVTPPIDRCAFGGCSDAVGGTIMSYCHLCPGGIANIDLRFDDRMADEFIRPFIQGGAPCNLVQPADRCTDIPPAPCLADVNGDGRLNGGDFAAWIIAYNAGDPRADINQDGQITPGDFNAWLAAFNAGCDFGDD
ncbi:MAG: M12 family metallo-peptidase [Planctomycetota bacterium]